jgi:hypothetical protein
MEIFMRPTVSILAPSVRPNANCVSEVPCDTAEEVETAAQAALLAAMDCDLAQGWHFGTPGSAAQISDLLRDR